MARPGKEPEETGSTGRTEHTGGVAVRSSYKRDNLSASQTPLKSFSMGKMAGTVGMAVQERMARMGDPAMVRTHPIAGSATVAVRVVTEATVPPGETAGTADVR